MLLCRLQLHRVGDQMHYFSRKSLDHAEGYAYDLMDTVVAQQVCRGGADGKGRVGGGGGCTFVLHRRWGEAWEGGLRRPTALPGVCAGRAAALHPGWRAGDLEQSHVRALQLSHAAAGSALPGQSLLSQQLTPGKAGRLSLGSICLAALQAPNLALLAAGECRKAYAPFGTIRTTLFAGRDNLAPDQRVNNRHFLGSKGGKGGRGEGGRGGDGAWCGGGIASDHATATPRPYQCAAFAAASSLCHAPNFARPNQLPGHCPAAALKEATASRSPSTQLPCTTCCCSQGGEHRAVRAGSGGALCLL